MYRPADSQVVAGFIGTRFRHGTRIGASHALAPCHDHARSGWCYGARRDPAATNVAARSWEACSSSGGTILGPPSELAYRAAWAASSAITFICTVRAGVSWKQRMP